MANQRVYQILVYRHELFKINFTGVPSSSSPVSPRFFPVFRSLSFSLVLHYLNAWNRLLNLRHSKPSVVIFAFLLLPYYFAKLEAYYFEVSFDLKVIRK